MTVSVQPRIYREESGASVRAVPVLAVQPDAAGQLLPLHLPALQRARPGLPGSHSLVCQPLQRPQREVRREARQSVCQFLISSGVFSGTSTSPGSGGVSSDIRIILTTFSSDGLLLFDIFRQEMDRGGHLWSVWGETVRGCEEHPARVQQHQHGPLLPPRQQELQVSQYMALKFNCFNATTLSTSYRHNESFDHSSAMCVM